MATRSAEETGLLQVALLVARDAPLEDVFAAVSEQIARRLRIEAGAVLRYVGDERAVIEGTWREGGSRSFPVNAELDFDRRNSAAGRARATGRPARADSYDDGRGELPVLMRASGLRSSIAVPVMVGEDVWGALIGSTMREDGLEPGAEDRVGDLAELTGRAVANAEAGRRLELASRRLVETADTDRRRLEHDLHDGVQQHLLALGLKLRVARGKAGEEVGALLDDVIADAVAINDELREFARRLYPTVLSERGLAAAVQAVAARTGVPVHLRELPRRRYPAIAEATAYFVVAEALAAAGEAAEGAADVAVGEREGQIVVQVDHPAFAARRPELGAL